MSALEAARIGDQIGHTCAMSGLLTGLVVGLIVAVVVVAAVAATIATAGAAAVLIGGVIAGVAGAGLAGMNIGATIDSDPKGPISSGSPNTFLGTGMRAAARAIVDTVACMDHSLMLIAQGSIDVFINNQPAARRTDGTVCSALIREGQPDVFFGGPTGTYLDMEAEVPGWLVTTLEWAMYIGAAIATGGAWAAVGFGAAVGGLLGSLGGGWLGAKIGGAIGGLFGRTGEAIGEAIGGFGGAILGGVAGGKLLGGRAPIAAEEAPIAPRKGPPVLDEAPAMRPDTSNIKYGPDASYRGPDGRYVYPLDDGFAGPRVNQDLPVGTRVDRFGGTGGRYLSPEWTPFAQRALPPSNLTEPYSVYRVAKPLPVESGGIAPAFDQPGGGVQYKTGPRIQQLIDDGYLVPVDP